MTALPALFVSHGAPTLALDESPARHALEALGRRMPRPEAIVVVSAHHEAAGPRVGCHGAPPTIHDFRGFPEALRRMRYPAPGAPGLAARIGETLRGAGFEPREDRRRGLDHGAWVPLRLLFPDADVPVVPRSIDVDRSPGWHRDLGRSLAPLADEGVLLLGSGSLTHGLPDLFSGPLRPDAPVPGWVASFADWVARRVEAGEDALLLEALERAPHARRNHPTPDHLLPLYFAWGAGGEGAVGRRLHASATYGVLAMDVYAFGAKGSLPAFLGL